MSESLSSVAVGPLTSVVKMRRKSQTNANLPVKGAQVRRSFIR